MSALATWLTPTLAMTWQGFPSLAPPTARARRWSVKRGGGEGVTVACPPPEPVVLRAEPGREGGEGMLHD